MGNRHHKLIKMPLMYIGDTAPQMKLNNTCINLDSANVQTIQMVLLTL